MSERRPPRPPNAGGRSPLGGSGPPEEASALEKPHSPQHWGAGGAVSAPMHKYPRTHHIEGSRLQPGDEDLESVPFRRLAGRRLVVEEKVDGANAGISFDAAGQLRLQSRGHILTGGPRERHFALFKAWASRHQARLRAATNDRYVIYGEWLYAKHTVYYDTLPHYFLEFDVLDTATETFLSTERRRALLTGLPLASVPVLHAGPLRTLANLRALLRPSLYKGANWQDSLALRCAEQGLDLATVRAETDLSDLMEGLYIKVEEGGEVVERYKFVRADFLATVLQSGSHWLDRPIVPNSLRAGVDIYADDLTPGSPA
jgi:hypothetical protein